MPTDKQGVEDEAKDEAETEEHVANSTTTPFRVLTVGDGDLSLSLALVRAYGSGDCSNDPTTTRFYNWELTATTLLKSAEELIQTYPDTAPHILRELAPYCESQNEEESEAINQDDDDGKDDCKVTTRRRRRRTPKVEILYHIDATQLHRHCATRAQKWNVIMFHHPHLGVFESEQEQAVQHQRLLAHYLWSASQCLAVPNDGILHLCLCGNQAHTWQLEETCRRLGLQLRMSHDVHQPFHVAVLDQPQWTPHPPPPNSHGHRRRYQKHGHHTHWLTRYGYHHQRTWGHLQKRSQKHVNLEGSFHCRILVRGDNNDDSNANITPQAQVHETSMMDKPFACTICNAQFDSETDLKAHFQQPAIPQPPSEDPIVPPTDRRVPDSTPQPNKDASNSLHRPTDQSQPNDNHHDKDDHNNADPPVGAQRLRKYVQQHFAVSKQHANRLIAQGRICINQTVVTDSARWVLPNGSGEITLVDPPPPDATTNYYYDNNNHKDPSVVSQSPEAPSASTEQGWDTSLTAEQPRSSNTVRSQLAVPIGGSPVELLDQWCWSRIPVTTTSSSNVAATTNLTMVVAWKPVGMRTLGKYGDKSKAANPRMAATQTLEERISHQQQQQQHQNDCEEQTHHQWFHSWTRLDTGCSGLCVLGSLPFLETTTIIPVIHCFTVLVHGWAPDEWSKCGGHPLDLHAQRVRRWKHRARPPNSNQPLLTSTVNEDDNKQNIDEDHVDSDNSNDNLQSMANQDVLTVRVVLLEKTTDPTVPRLSTLRVETTRTVSGMASLISHGLRHCSQPTLEEDATNDRGFPVVGDRHSRLWDAKRLPRPMKNRIKHRLCMACTSVSIGHDPASSTRTCMGNEQTNTLSLDGASWQAEDKSQLFPYRSYSKPIPDKWKALYWQTFLSQGRSRDSEN